MTGAELKERMQLQRISVRALAQKTGSAERTVYRWRSGELPVPQYVETLLRLLGRRPGRKPKQQA